MKSTNVPNYPALEQFRYQIRRFLRFSERAARAEGLEPQQYMLLLMLKGLPTGRKPTVGDLAERLQIEHNSAVELIDRSERRGLIRRYRLRFDRRKVFVRITQKGERIFRDLSVYHLAELKLVGFSLVRELRALFTEATLFNERSDGADDVEEADRHLPQTKNGNDFTLLKQEHRIIHELNAQRETKLENNSPKNRQS
jgi:DNA-binding MarR family transcriptional regulator